MSGLKLQVCSRDVANLAIGQRARLLIPLDAETNVKVIGRVVHVQRTGGTWLGSWSATWSVGLVFPAGRALQAAQPVLARYLLAQVKRQERLAA